MLSRDLVHLCDHELPTREEKRENKVKKIKQKKKHKTTKYVKIQYKKRPCFSNSSNPGFLSYYKNKLNNQIYLTDRKWINEDLLEAVQVCVAERDSDDTNRFWREGKTQGVSRIFLGHKFIAGEIFLISLGALKRLRLDGFY